MAFDTLVMADDDDDVVINYVADVDTSKRIERKSRKALNDLVAECVQYESAPDPPRYLGGACLYRPMPGIEIAIARAMTRPDWTLLALCGTCQEVLDRTEYYDEELSAWRRRKASFVIGAASDHDRININHNIVVYALPDRKAIWKSKWHPFDTSAGVRKR